MVSKALRDSARGQDCTLQIPGVCNFNPETTVLAHLPDETNGMGKKSDDISACFACSDCHAHIDANRLPDSDDWMLRRAMVRTWRQWIEMGLVKVKGL